MAEKEMLVTINEGWLYFKANVKTAETGFDRLLEAFEDAGIDVSNVEFGSCELRDGDGDTIDEFQINPARNRHYDCYEAYEKGKRDAINTMKKMLEDANV